MPLQIHTNQKFYLTNKLERKLVNFLPVSIRSKPVIFNISFISSNEIKKLNKRFRSINKPCEIISFPLLNDSDLTASGSEIEIGDIFICKSVAKSHKFSLKLLCIHGFLHLVGQTHNNLNEQKNWDKIESKILNSFQ